MKRLGAAFIMLVGLAARAQSQTTPDTLSTGTVVRLTLSTRQVQSGRLLSPLWPGSPSLNYCLFPAPCGNENRHNLRLTEIIRLETVVRTRVLEGGLVGETLGAGVLALVHFWYCNAEECTNQGSRRLQLGIAGGAIGGLAGAFLGSGIRTWEPWQALPIR